MSVNVEGNAIVKVDGQQAGQQIESLEEKAKQLRNELKKIRKQEFVDEKQVKKVKTELNKTNQEVRALKKNTFDYNNVLKNLSGSSIRDLTKLQAKLNFETKMLGRNTVAYAQKSSQLKKVKGELSKIRTEMSGLNKQGSLFGRMADGFNRFAMIGATVVAAITGIVMAFKKMSDIINTFEKSLTNVYTLLSDEDFDNFHKKLEKGSIKIIKKYGFAIEDTNKALFDTISAGVPAGEAIGVLDEAARLAVGGVTNLSIATDGLTTVMNAWDLEATEANKVTSAFFSAQKAGKTTVEELSNSIGKAAPIAAQLGISYQEVLSSMAEMTKGGITTSEASTKLTSVMAALIKPSKEAAKVLEEYGVPMGVSEVKAKGFRYTLEKLNEMIKANPDAAAKAIPKVEALSGVFALSGEKLKDYDNILAQVNEDYGKGSSLAKGFAKQQLTTSQIIAKAKGSLTALVLGLKDHLTPAINAVMKGVSLTSNVIVKLMANNKNLLGGLGSLVKGFFGLFSAFKPIFLAIGEFLSSIFNLGKAFSSLDSKGSILKFLFKSLKIQIEILFEPLRLLIIGFSKIVNGIAYFIKHSKMVKQPVEALILIFNTLSNLFDTASKNSGFFGKSIKWLSEKFSGLLKIGKKVLDFMLLIDQESVKADERKAKKDAYLSKFTNNAINQQKKLLEQMKESATVSKEKADAEIEQLKIKTEAEKEAAKETAKAKLSANKNLADQIQNLNLQLLTDERTRAEKEVEIWAKKEAVKIENSKASARLKNEALTAIDKTRYEKLQKIEDDYNQKSLDKFTQTEQFLKGQNQQIAQERQDIINSEIKAIEEKYNKQIAIAQAEIDAKTELSEQFLEKKFQLETTKEDEIKAYKLQKEQEFAEQLLAVKEEYGLIDDAEKEEAEIEKLNEYYDNKLISDEDYQIAKAEIEKRYNDEQLKKQAENYRKETELLKNKIRQHQIINSTLSGAVSSMKELELQEAGENEAEKLAIKKKYANIEFALKISEIIGSTAVGVMAAWETPAIAPFLIPLIVGAGLLQGGLAASERNKIMGLAEGGKIPVERAQDGRYFDADFEGNSVGYFNKPSVLVAEEGPEFVVSNKSMRNPEINGIIKAIDYYQRGNNVSFDYPRVINATNRMRGFADGGYVNSNNNQETSNTSNDNQEILEFLVLILNALSNVSSTIAQQQTLLKAYITLEDIEEAETTINDLKADTTLQ